MGNFIFTNDSQQGWDGNKETALQSRARGATLMETQICKRKPGVAPQQSGSSGFIDCSLTKHRADVLGSFVSCHIAFFCLFVFQ